MPDYLLLAFMAGCSRLVFPLLLLFALVLGTASPSLAATVMCSEFTKVRDLPTPAYEVDGTNPAHLAAIQNATTFGIDADCTIKNFPAPDGFPIVNINYQFWGGNSYFIVFDDVYYPGGMSCNNAGPDVNFWIYWSPGSFNNISDNCQARMVPVDAVTKSNPAGQTTALIGVPFKYTITAPLKAAWDVKTDTLNIVQQFDDVAINNVVITDDLTKTGAALTYVSNTAYLVNKQSPSPRIPIGSLNEGGASAAWLTAHPVPLPDGSTEPRLQSDGKHLVFSYENNWQLADIPAGYNIEIDLEVVLDGAPVGVNPPGTTFTNFAEMWFDRDYSGLPETDIHAKYYITPPMTIVEPNLVVDKSSTVATLNVGSTAPFKIDVKNAGSSTAFNVTVKDNIPAGMCMFDPQPSVDAGIYAADGTTLVYSLIKSSDYTLNWTGPSASACSLTLTLQSTAEAKIEPAQRLIITYGAKLDAGTASGLDFTNVAGAESWFNAGSGPRFEYVKNITDGTPGDDDDFQDAQTIRSAVAGYYFLKTVEDRTTGDYPAKEAFPGDVLRYTLVLQNYTWPTLENINITDDLGSLTAAGVFVSGISIVSNTFPVAPTYCDSCGTNGAPQITLTGFSRAQITDTDPEYKIEFDVTLNANLGTDTLVSNQALLSGQVESGGTIYSDAGSDDPNDTGGPVLLGDAATGPTDLKIQAPGALAKANPAGKTTATIGERFTYSITVPEFPVNLPLYDVQIKDTLPANLGLISAAGHLALGTQTWSLINVGTVPNELILKDAISGIDIPPGDQVIIEVEVEVLNSDTNNSGDTFNNTAYYTYNKLDDVLSDGTGGSDTTDSITITEPLLTVAKTVSFVSPPGKLPADPTTVGDILQYTVTINNTGTSTAYDTNIVDTLPANVNFLPGSAAAKIDGATVSGFNPDPLMDPPTPSGTPVTLKWGDGNGDESLDISVGEELVLTYQVIVVDATSAPSFTNSVYVDWTSLQGAYPIDPLINPAGRERTGEGCPNTISPNEYCAGPASVTVLTADNTSIAKSVYADSYAESPASTGDPIVRVGDTVTYDLTLNLQEYTTRNVVIEDTLPAGLAFESVVSINGDNASPFTSVAPFSYNDFTGPTVSGNTVIWSFGDIDNAPDGISTNNTMVIRYVARVLTDAPPVGVGYATLIPLANQARLSYTGGDPDDYPSRLQVAEQVEVRQPLMEPISKVDMGTGRTGTGTAADPYQVNIASDVMNFRLESCNRDGLAPAYNVKLSDVLASQLDETSITALAVSVGGVVLAASDYSLTPPPPLARGGTMSVVLNVPVNPAECVTVDYNIGFHTDVGPNQTWNNSATLDEYWSLPADGRIYQPNSSSSVYMTNQVSVTPLSKTLVSPPEATIGEDVVYEITVPSVPISAALDKVVVRDMLDDALYYVSATATLNGSLLNITTTQNMQELTIDVGAIPAGQQAVITLTTRVDNNFDANAGTIVTNTASYTYTDIPAGSVTDDTSGPLTIVEPSLTIKKDVSPAAPPSAGDTLNYSVTLTAESGAIFSSAFDADLVDTLSLGLAYVTGSALVDGVAVEPTRSGNGTSTPQTLTWTGAVDIPEGASVAVTYDVQVLSTVVAGQVLTNSAIARWTSLNGLSSYERTGSGTPPYNDYFTGPASTSLIVSDNNSLTKEIIADTYVDAPSTASDKTLRIGDTATYRLTLKLGEGTTLSVKVKDELPTGMAYDSLVNITPALPGSTFDYSVFSEPSPNDTGTLEWDLGDVVNYPSNDNTAFDALIIEYKARVLPDTITHVPSTYLDNAATLSYKDAGGNTVVDPDRLESKDKLTLLQPVMSPIEKSDRLGRIGDQLAPLNVNVASDVMQFRLESCNTSGLAPAYSIQITDVLASQLDETSITALAVSVGGVVLAASDYSLTPPLPPARGGTMVFLLNTPVDPGQCVTVDYDIGFHTDFGPNLTWNNSATLDEYWSLPAQSGQRYAPGFLSEFHMTNQVSVTPLSKTLVSPSEATIGEDVVYEITVPSVPISAALDGVVVSDELDDALYYVSATATLNGSTLNITPQPGPPLTIDIGTIPAGQQAVITLTTRVDNNIYANAGTTFTNKASYTYTNIPAGAVTDDTSGPLTIVEPSLTIAKAVANVTQPGAAPQAGDFLRYTVTLTASSGADFSGAFDAGLEDSLSLGLFYRTGTATVNGTGNTINNATVSGDGINTRQTLVWDPADSTADIDIAEGTTVTITYEVRVLDTVVAGQVLTNDVTVRWTSLDGTSLYERTGADGVDGLNDYVATAAAPPLTIPIPTLTIRKIVDRPVANPGDRVHYTIIIQNSTGIRVDNLSLDDEIERLNATPGFQPGSIGNVSVPAGASYAINGGTLSVTGLNIGPNETQTVEFEAVLLTNLKGGTVVLNQAELQGPWPAPIKSDDPSVPGTDDPTATFIPGNGVVYDAVSRTPLGGVTLTMRLASSGAVLPASCFIDPSQQNQVTPATGEYKFDLQFDPINCPEAADYLIAVAAVPAGYVAEPSLAIPPTSDSATAAYSVPVCSADAIPATAQCEAQVSTTAPTGGVTTYYLHLTLDSSANQIFNNHIPVDPYVEEKVSITKTTPLINVTRGQLVPYTITYKNTWRTPLPPLGVVDTLPAGFKYVKGSSRIDDTPIDPVENGRQLEWRDLTFDFNQRHTIKMLLVVGAGVTEGEHVNRARVMDTLGAPYSEEATATVRAVADPTFDCTDVIGKVFDDLNLNGYQDSGENGLPGVRVVTARGLASVSDEYGRFEITCAAVPDENRGSNFILKLDERSLPTGYRLTTENPRVQRATRGKMLRFNFGATIHRVVRMDVADGVFEPDTTELRVQWAHKIGQLIEELKKAPSVLRLSYLGDVERKGLVQDRLEWLKTEITRQWEQSDGGYRLDIETEIFWRRGAPPAGK